MVQMTLQVPEELAERIQPMTAWLPTILELGLVGCKTRAAALVSEVIGFLATAPSPREVLDYHVSERAQGRLQRLLTLNEAGLLGEPERLELDELQRVEHVLVMLKSQVAQQLMPRS